MHDEDNDGRFPDESPVEVRYPRSKREEQGDRERWPWLPGTIVRQCSPDEWYVCVEVRELAVLRDGRRAPRGTASRNLYCPCCFRDAASVAAGQPLSQRAMAERFGLSRRKVSQLITSVSAESNGHALAGKRGLGVNRYGVMARRHWARWLPRQYTAISDPDSFFTVLGEEAVRQIDDLTDELAGETGQGDSYLARVAQLVTARALAEELILPQQVLPQPELAVDDQEDIELERGERPIVVGRNHPSWAEVDAEQQERASDPEPG